MKAKAGLMMIAIVAMALTGFGTTTSDPSQNSISVQDDHPITLTDNVEMNSYDFIANDSHVAIVSFESAKATTTLNQSEAIGSTINYLDVDVAESSRDGRIPIAMASTIDVYRSPRDFVINSQHRL